MATRFPMYTVQDDITDLDEAYFNRVFRDIDSRIDRLEVLRNDLDAEIRKLTDLGLLRIDEALLPVLAEAQATAQELLDIVAAAQAGIDAAFAAQNATIDALSNAVNTTLTELSGDVTEQIDGFADLLNVLNEKMRLGRGIVIVDAADLAAADMGNTGAAPFSTISHPITLQGGDLPNSLTIQVAAGTYAESVTCQSNKNLTLINTSKRAANVQISTLTLPESPTYNEMHVHLSHVTLGTIQLPTTAGQRARGTLVLENCVITGQMISGISSNHAIQITARNCTFSHSAPFDNLYTGGLDDGGVNDFARLTLEDCAFTYNGVSIAPKATGTTYMPPLKRCTFSSVTLDFTASTLESCNANTVTIGGNGLFQRTIRNSSVGKVQFGASNMIVELQNCTLNTTGTYAISTSAFTFNEVILADCSAVGTAIAIEPGITVTNQGAALGTVLTATATLDFPSINASSSADLTVTVNRAAVGDEVAVIPPTALLTNMVAYGFVSAANTVTVRLLNNSTAAQNPASGSFKVIVRK